MLVLTNLIGSVLGLMFSDASFARKFFRVELLLVLLACKVSIELRVGLRSLLLLGGVQLNWNVIALLLSSYWYDILALLLELTDLCPSHLGSLLLLKFVL